jgi:hypothetical protein
MYKLSVAVVIIYCLAGCGKQTESSTVPSPDDFDIAHSDPAAVELADTILSVAGGEQRWQKIRFISWKDGSHNFYWDKASHNVRIESPEENIISIVNLNAVDGQVKVNGTILESSDSTYKQIIQLEKEKWIQSSTKMFFPFLLKREGFALKYLGEEARDDHRFNVLQVDDTVADLSYKLFVDLLENTITQLESAQLGRDSVLSKLTFRNYKDVDGIRVAVPDGSHISELSINGNLPEKLFTDL